MIIACPACATRYVVPDSAIGVEGRTVRCAKCRHSWFQDGPEIAPPPASPPPPPAEPAAPIPPAPIADEITGQGFAAEPEPDPDQESFAEDPAARYFQDEPAGGAPEPAEAVPPPAADHADDGVDYEEAAPAPDEYGPREGTVEEEELPPSPVYQDLDEDYSRFEHEPPFKPRRNTLKLLTIAGVIFALLALGTMAAVSYWGLPDWVPISRPTFARAQPDLVLEFPPNKQDRRTMPNGAEFFSASGTVKNIGSSARDVPSILIVLRDARERIVYSWEVVPPKSSLAPGESLSINEARTDVPRSAKFAEIGWKPA